MADDILFNDLVLDRLERARRMALGYQQQPPANIPADELQKRSEVGDPTVLTHPRFDSRAHALVVYQNIDGEDVLDVYYGLNATRRNCEIVGNRMKEAAERAEQPELEYKVVLVQPIPDVHNPS